MHISNFQHRILQFIEANDYEQAFKIAANFDDEFRFVLAIHDLIDRRLVDYCPDQTKEQCISNYDQYHEKKFKFDISYHLYLTELGYSVLDKCNERQLKLSVLQKDTETNSNQLAALKECIDLYKIDLTNAQKDARDAKIRAAISFIISICAIIVPLLYG